MAILRRLPTFLIEPQTYKVILSGCFDVLQAYKVIFSGCVTVVCFSTCVEPKLYEQIFGDYFVASFGGTVSF